MDAPDRHNRQTDRQTDRQTNKQKRTCLFVNLFVCLCLRWSLTLTSCCDMRCICRRVASQALHMIAVTARNAAPQYSAASPADVGEHKTSEFWRIAGLSIDSLLKLIYTHDVNIPTSSDFEQSATERFVLRRQKMWNSLPPEVTSSATLSTFKHTL